MDTTRRGCLKTALAVSLAPPAWPEPEPAGPADSSFDPWVEVHPENLRNNVREMSRRAGSRPILAVIKNNGYGLGVENVGRVFEPMVEVAGFAVVKLDEAVRLRESGIKKPVLLMGPFDEKNLEDVVAKNILPMVYTPIGPSLDRVSRKFQKPVQLHICVDTGLGREGVPYRVAGALIKDLAGRKSTQIVGTMMTFAEDPEFDGEQLRRFQGLCGSLEPRDCVWAGSTLLPASPSFSIPMRFSIWCDPGWLCSAFTRRPSFAISIFWTCGRVLRCERAWHISSSFLRTRARDTSGFIGEAGHVGGDAAGGARRWSAAQR
jgi:hypothetical protein